MKEGIQQLKTHENPRSLTTLVDFVLEDDSQQLPFQGKTHILFHINNVTIKGCLSCTTSSMCLIILSLLNLPPLKHMPFLSCQIIQMQAQKLSLQVGFWKYPPSTFYTSWEICILREKSISLRAKLENIGSNLFTYVMRQEEMIEILFTLVARAS